MEANDLEVLLRSRVPIIAVDSRDEALVIKTLARACAQQSTPASLPRTAAGGGMTTLSGAPVVAVHPGLPLFQWTVTDGLKRLDVDMGPPQRTLDEPADVLKHIRATTLAGAYALLDFHPYLSDPTIVRLLKDIAQEYERCARTVVLIASPPRSRRSSST